MPLTLYVRITWRAWAIVELAVMTGEQGANRFGVSPVKGAAPT